MYVFTRKEQEKSRDLEASIVKRKEAEEENEHQSGGTPDVLEHLTEGLVISDWTGTSITGTKPAIEMHGFQEASLSVGGVSPSLRKSSNLPLLMDKFCL